MGNNLHGNKNEKSLSDALHDKKFKDLPNLNLKTFIREIHPTVMSDTLIQCPFSPGMKKQDIKILIDDQTYNVSLKTGSGNSIHQEKLEPFLKMLQDNYSISNDLLNDIRFFVWGDGTYDGNGLKSNRLGANELKKKYPELIKRIHLFFDAHKSDLLNRFLVTGRFEGHIDYIYYGTVTNGVWCSAEEALKFHVNYSKKSQGSIKLGNTTFQTWNRCIKGSAKEAYRDTIQLKWGAIQKDITNIRNSVNNLNLGTQEGDTGEYNFCRELNKNRRLSNKYWKILLDNLSLPASLDNIYAIKVSNNVFSELAKTKVMPKTDLYLIEGNINPNFLLLHNHLLDENLLKAMKYKSVIGSGISVKRHDSKKYTIQKLSINSFISLFKKPYLGAGASLYCNTKELHKNDLIIAAWGSSYQDFIEYFGHIDQIKMLDDPGSSIETKAKICKEIKKFCNEEIKQIILKNQNMLDLIFTGKDNFPEPYVANFIYKNGTLDLNLPTDFLVTTGSGRSKGIYTIEIKPK